MLLSSHQAIDACHSRLTGDNKRYIRQNMHVLCNLRWGANLTWKCEARFEYAPVETKFSGKVK